MKLFATVEQSLNRTGVCFAIILAFCALVVIVPMALRGVHASGDTFVYLAFGQELKDAISTGDISPGWANDNSGFGSVGIRFYPPLVVYSATFLSFITGDWYHSLLILFFAWMLVGCWGVFLFVRDWSAPRVAVVAACFYAVVPFHLAEIYQFSLIAQFAAGAVFVYCTLYLVRVFTRANASDTYGLALSGALLGLVHLPTAIIGTISLSILGLMLSSRPYGSSLKRLGISIALALAATSFYWVPLVTELGWVAHSSTVYSSGESSYAENLFPLPTSTDQSRQYAIPVHRNLNAMVMLTFLVFIPAALVSLLSGDDRRRRVIRAVTASSLLGFFMLSALSKPLWDYLPLLYRIQFPWRWTGVLSSLGAVSLGISAELIAERRPSLQKPIAAFTLGILALITAYDVRQGFLRPNTISPTDIATMLEERNAQKGTTLQAWWPAWATADAFDRREAVIAASRPVAISNWSREHREFSIAGGEPSLVRIATFYYPHWRAIVNGKKVAVTPAEDGTITFPIGEEASDVLLDFREPGAAVAAGWISAAAVCLLLALLIRAYARSKMGRPNMVFQKGRFVS